MLITPFILITVQDRFLLVVSTECKEEVVYPCSPSNSDIADDLK